MVAGHGQPAVLDVTDQAAALEELLVNRSHSSRTLVLMG
jgi:hypothetical protein